MAGAVGREQGGGEGGAREIHEREQAAIGRYIERRDTPRRGAEVLIERRFRVELADAGRVGHEDVVAVGDVDAFAGVDGEGQRQVRPHIRGEPRARGERPGPGRGGVGIAARTAADRRARHDWIAPAAAPAAAPAGPTRTAAVRRRVTRGATTSAGSADHERDPDTDQRTSGRPHCDYPRSRSG